VVVYWVVVEREFRLFIGCEEGFVEHRMNLLPSGTRKMIGRVSLLFLNNKGSISFISKFLGWSGSSDVCSFEPNFISNYIVLSFTLFTVIEPLHCFSSLFKRGFSLLMNLLYFVDKVLGRLTLVFSSRIRTFVRMHPMVDVEQ